MGRGWTCYRCGAERNAQGRCSRCGATVNESRMCKGKKGGAQRQGVGQELKASGAEQANKKKKKSKSSIRVRAIRKAYRKEFVARAM